MLTTRTLCLFALCGLAVALPAQGGKGKTKKPVAESKQKPESKQKDDALTAKDKAIVAVDKFIAKNKVDDKAPDWRAHLRAPELLPFDAAHDYFWHLQTTQGDITVKLLPDAAPMHVSSVIYLTRRGFYDGRVFFRVIKGFMAQGGSPNDTASGDPGYSMDGELDPKQKHDGPGVLSTANTGQPKTDGSQFFLTFQATPFLDGKHTIAGRVTEGLEALKAIEANGSDDNNGVPKAKMSIARAWIVVADKPKEEGANEPAKDPAPARPGRAGDE